MAATPGTFAGFDVAPSVPDTDALDEVEVQPRGGVKHHSGPRLAARAVVDVVMCADHDLVHRQPPAQCVMHPVDLVAGLLTPGNVWLVGHDNQSEAQASQTMAGFDYAGQ
jgi:hypothetical protein